jgi:hypothetical protein
LDGVEQLQAHEQRSCKRLAEQGKVSPVYPVAVAAGLGDRPVEWEHKFGATKWNFKLRKTFNSINMDTIAARIGQRWPGRELEASRIAALSSGHSVPDFFVYGVPSTGKTSVVRWGGWAA